MTRPEISPWEESRIHGYRSEGPDTSTTMFWYLLYIIYECIALISDTETPPTTITEVPYSLIRFIRDYNQLLGKVNSSINVHICEGKFELRTYVVEKYG